MKTRTESESRAQHAAWASLIVCGLLTGCAVPPKVVRDLRVTLTSEVQSVVVGDAALQVRRRFPCGWPRGRLKGGQMGDVDFFEKARRGNAVS